jgi:hypothetical protein
MTSYHKKETQNPTILKFEFEDLLPKMKVLNKKHRRGKIITSCPATILLTLCKKRFMSGNFIAIEKYNIVEWKMLKTP